MGDEELKREAEMAEAALKEAALKAAVMKEAEKKESAKGKEVDRSGWQKYPPTPISTDTISNDTLSYLGETKRKIQMVLLCKVMMKHQVRPSHRQVILVRRLYQISPLQIDRGFPCLP